MQVPCRGGSERLSDGSIRRRSISPARAPDRNRNTYLAPGGSLHTFYASQHENELATSGVEYSRDGSYLRLNTATAQIEMSDGTIHSFSSLLNGYLTRIEDGFGNFVQIDYLDCSSTPCAPHLAPFEKVELGPGPLLQKTSAEYRRSFLRAMHVQSISIDDPEQVGSYGFNEVIFKPNRGIVLIATGVPIKIELRVAALEVIVEITDEVLAKEEGRRIMFDLFSKPRRNAR